MYYGQKSQEEAKSKQNCLFCKQNDIPKLNSAL